MVLLNAPLQNALQGAGFRALTSAEAAAGPFAVPRGESRYVRFEPDTYLIAFVAALDRAAGVIPFLEHLEASAWGYDLNLEHRAASIQNVQEFRFVVVDDVEPAGEELRWLGYRQHGAMWHRCDTACPVPAPGPEHEGEIFPCLGWVPLPGATAEWAAAEQRPGFCSRLVPREAQAIRDVRGYHFIHAGYPERLITRRQVITFIDPAQADGEVSALVGEALALVYGAA